MKMTNLIFVCIQKADDSILKTRFRRKKPKNW